jgi:hypothetical protein
MHGARLTEANMKPTELMTWAGPFPPDVIEAWCAEEMHQLMTLAGPISPPDDEPSIRITASSGETIFWAGPLPPDDEEFPRRRSRSVLSRPPRAERPQAKV